MSAHGYPFTPAATRPATVLRPAEDLYLDGSIRTTRWWLMSHINRHVQRIMRELCVEAGVRPFPRNGLLSLGPSDKQHSVLDSEIILAVTLQLHECDRIRPHVLELRSSLQLLFKRLQLGPDLKSIMFYSAEPPSDHRQSSFWQAYRSKVVTVSHPASSPPLQPACGPITSAPLRLPIMQHGIQHTYAERRPEMQMGPLPGYAAKPNLTDSWEELSRQTDLVDIALGSWKATSSSVNKVVNAAANTAASYVNGPLPVALPMAANTAAAYLNDPLPAYPSYLSPNPWSKSQRGPNLDRNTILHDQTASNATRPRRNAIALPLSDEDTSYQPIAYHNGPSAAQMSSAATEVVDKRLATAAKATSEPQGPINELEDWDYI